MSAVIRAPRVEDPRVEEVSDVRGTMGDGVWFYLKPGWRWGDVHFIHEDTKTKCRALLPEIVPCTCKECELLILRGGA